ncbi:unnamed protein product [Phytophthora lilii]|uniref:RNA-directed DNA polymerase n=1 Tax=Phytophthora lilii TaxID=2077276 RepID=A0A9W6TKJ2_9STRA|nr:unnamed protein product [Phytophthora lilii]
MERSKRWCDKEDEVIALAYKAAAENSVQGIDQKACGSALQQHLVVRAKLCRSSKTARQMAATLQQQQQQQAPPPQQQQVDAAPAPDTREYRAEDIKMPTFYGTKDDDVADYMSASGLANLKGPAAAWYREYVSHEGNFLQSVAQFEELMTSEFTAPDKQEHLRDLLLRLRQKNFACLEDYVSSFRSIICKVEDMSDIDKVMHFQKGLLVEIRQEVMLRQFRNTTDAISFALMYDRTHSVSIRGQGRDTSRRTPAQRQSRASAEEPTPMEIGSSRFVSRDECMRNNLCFYCKEPGHRLASCRKRQGRTNSRGPSDRGRGQPSCSAHQSAFRRVVEADVEDDDSSDEVEVMQSMQLNMVTAQVAASASPTRGLLRLDGVMNGQPVRILVDSGAEQNIVRPGLAHHYVEAANVTAERFDDTTTPARVAQRCLESLNLGGREFHGVSLIEWEVSANQDVILGHPWLVQFNPIIDWQTGEMHFRKHRVVRDYRSLNTGAKVPEPVINAVKVKPEFLQHPLPAHLRQQRDDHVKAGYFHMPLGPTAIPSLVAQAAAGTSVEKMAAAGEDAAVYVVSAAQFEQNVQDHEYAELFHVTVKTSPKVKPVPPQLQAVLDEYADVEQAALELFVADLLKKNWIQVSDSPWVSNIFGVPKKDPATGKFPSRLEWLRSADPHMPIRWVIDYRLVNAASDVAKIPLPHIEELFDQMEGATVFSILDLASGSVDFLGHTISSEGLHVDARKTRAIAEWKEPGNVQELQQFLGLAGYYRWFIHGFAQLVLPLSSLVKQNVDWVWDEPQRRAFNSIKLALQQAPVPRLPDFDRPFIVTTDASHDCVGGVLSQLHDGHDLPVAFYSKKLGVHELNWPVHEKELFAIKQALTRWRHYLHGSHFDVVTDNSACKWFLQHPRVSGRLARWLDFFASFDFKLHHRPGSQNVVADALSRPPTASPLPGGESDDAVTTISVCALRFSCSTCSTVRKSSARRMATTDTLLTISSRDQAVMLGTKHPASPARSAGASQKMIQMNATAVETTTTVSSIQLDRATKKSYQKAYASDPAYKKLWRTKTNSSDYELLDGLIYLKGSDSVRRLCVPNHRQLRLNVIHNVHDAAIMAHPGARRTQLAAAQWYYWPGKLQPIPLPSACWEVVSTDFITHLPVSDKFDAIIVVVDKLSKRPVYIPTHTTATAEDTAKLFFNYVIRYYGIPTTIISDRDPKFTSKFWSALTGLMKIKTAMTPRRTVLKQTARQNDKTGRWRTPIAILRRHRPATQEPLSSVTNGEPAAVSKVEYGSRFVHHRQEVIELARKNLRDAQAAQKKYYDKRRADNPFKVGDLALLSTQDLNISHATADTTLRSRKFTARFIGPYTIRELHGNVVLLDLPANLKHLSPRFNVDKLKVYKSNPVRFSGRVIPKSTPVVFDDDGEKLHIVEALIRQRMFDRKLEYLVKWHGLPHHENTWERERDIKHVSHWKDLPQELRQRTSTARAGGKSLN